jgi:2-polyprenyl-3-methyl-5-hydroxy-6-metoxy-1,4-benzoquinol methylase
MTEAVDYFSNHRLKLRFPWSLYHRPIVHELGAALRDVRGSRVLNIGSGPFFELDELEATDKRFTLCDIDPRAVELAERLHGNALEATTVIAATGTLPYASASFHAVVSMDVIEHVVDPLPWLTESLRVLKPGGLLFLTTPNYASLSQRAIENTALELIARAQGFSRKTMHPTKLDADRLTTLLRRAGVERVRIAPIALGWVLAARAWK